MKKLLTLVLICAACNAMQAQVIKAADAPLRKDGITVKRMGPTAQVAPAMEKKGHSLLAFRKKKREKYKFRVTICPSF